MISAINQSPAFGTGYILRSKKEPEVVAKTIVDFAKENGIKINPDKIQKLSYGDSAGNHYLFDVKDSFTNFWTMFKGKFGDNAFKC